MMQARKTKYDVMGLTETRRHQHLHAAYDSGEELFLGACDSRRDFDKPDGSRKLLERPANLPRTGEEDDGHLWTRIPLDTGIVFRHERLTPANKLTIELTTRRQEDYCIRSGSEALIESRKSNAMD
ncbi:unnamed protein product [Heligmosomoides polygyrus]|uniref:Proteasome accessory factor PafA2 n=1 Tax=Heligmosomoides polygyrus TaxID=6339 RepID=A0A183GCZ4_HELPZ|nr:unnamed protein product [Heligmosomoides polygyrus]